MDLPSDLGELFGRVNLALKKTPKSVIEHLFIQRGKGNKSLSHISTASVSSLEPSEWTNFL